MYIYVVTENFHRSPEERERSKGSSWWARIIRGVVCREMFCGVLTVGDRDYDNSCVTKTYKRKQGSGGTDNDVGARSSTPKLVKTPLCG